MLDSVIIHRRTRRPFASHPSSLKIDLAVVHGGLWGRNVLAASGRTSVVDWDAFHYGASLEDLLAYALGSVFPRWPDMDRSASLIWDVFFGRSPVAIHPRVACARWLTRLGSPQDLLRPIFLMNLIDRINLLFPDQVSAGVEMKTVGGETRAQLSILEKRHRAL
jgi:hypothetical protein